MYQFVGSVMDHLIVEPFRGVQLEIARNRLLKISRWRDNPDS